MKSNLLILVLLNSFNLTAQVAIGTTNPHPGAILDLTSTDKSLLVTRVINTSAITNPTNGMIIYDLSSSCFKAYQNNTWSDCFASNGSLSSLACGTATNSGTIIQGVNTTNVAYFINYTGGNGGSYVGQTVTSTGVTGLTAICNGGTFVNGNGTLIYTIVGTAASNGIASFALNIGGQTCTLNTNVVGPEINSLDCSYATHNGTLTSGQGASGVYSTINYTGGNGAPYPTQTVSSTGVTGLTATLTMSTLATGVGSLVYTITGTPSSYGVASFPISFGGQTCVLTRNVISTVGSIATLNCSSATITGALNSGIAASGVTASIPYTGGSGGPHSGQTVSSTGVTGLTATLNAGNFALNTGNLSYTITGTPTSQGTASFMLNIGGQTCTLNMTVYPNGSASFTNTINNAYVFSVNDVALPLNSQGTLAIGSTINVAYAGGAGNYIAYTSPDIPISASYCEDGASDWTIGYSYNAGTFASSGDLIITIITKKAGVVTAWPAKRVSNISTINFNLVSLPLVINGLTKPNTIGIDEGGDAIRGSLSTSGSVYDAAAVNDIIRITQAEYNTMTSVIPNLIIAGKVNIADGAGGLGANTWTQHGDGSNWINLPTNSYMCGFAYAHNTGNPSTYYRMGCASSISGSVTPLTNYSGPFSTGNTTYYFYAIKRPSNHCGSNTLITASSTADMGGRNMSSGTNSYVSSVPSNGGIPTPNSSLPTWTPTVQVKTTTIKSW